MKKIFAVILALAMIACLSISVFAEAGTNTITINGIAEGHTYAAYQLFDGDLSGGALTNVKWGDGIDGAAFLAALKADTYEIKNSDGSIVVTMAKYFEKATSAQDVIGVIVDPTDAWSSHGDRLDRFAEIAGQFLTTASATTSVCDSNFAYKLEGIADGYYLVRDITAVGETPDDPIENDFFTKFIITVTTDVAINVKGDKPVVNKTVGYGLSEDFSEYISNQIGKTHYYRWIGTLPTDLGEYDDYYYSFEDTLSAGLTFGKFEQIYIVHSNNSHTLVYNSVDGTENADLMPDSYTSAGAATVNADGTSSISLTWNDLLDTFPTLKSSDKVYVKYSATLNKDAVIGVEGNPNEVTLKYSNSPSDEGYGITLPDDAIVYSFMMNVVKVDAADNSVFLPGAEFLLYHFHEDVKVYAVLDAEFKIDSWTENADEATVLRSSDADGSFKVIGLQGGLDYFLHEKTAPVGYNKLFTDIEVRLVPGYDPTNASHEYLITLDYELDGQAGNGTITDGAISIEVVNHKGATLPSTGGIGTTVFYIAGTLLVLCAVVYLVSKKRMSVK